MHETTSSGSVGGAAASYGPVPRALANSVGYLLHRAHLLAEQVALRYMAPSAHPRDFAILVTLRSATPRSQLDLAGALDVNRSVMVKVVHDLERRGLVERRRSPEDRRRYVLAVTEKGQQAVDEMSTPVFTASREYTAPLTADEVGELNRLLRPLVLAGRTADLPPLLADITPFLVVHTYMRLVPLASEAVADLGIQPRHYGLLAVLADLGPVPQQRIAQDLGVSGPTVVDMVDALEASGHLRRERSTADRRAYALTLTAAGERDLAAAHRRLHEVAGRFTAPIGAAGHDRLRALLRTLVGGTPDGGAVQNLGGSA